MLYLAELLMKILERGQTWNGVPIFPYKIGTGWHDEHCMMMMSIDSLARATPVWKNRGLVTALHTTSSDHQNLNGSRE